MLNTPLSWHKQNFFLDVLARTVTNDTGEKIRILTIVDAYTRESLQIGIGFTYKASEVVKTLNQVIQRHGISQIIRIDNGPEFIRKDPDLWAYHHKVTLRLLKAGQTY